MSRPSVLSCVTIRRGDIRIACSHNQLRRRVEIAVVHVYFSAYLPIGCNELQTRRSVICPRDRRVTRLDGSGVGINALHQMSYVNLCDDGKSLGLTSADTCALDVCKSSVSKIIRSWMPAISCTKFENSVENFFITRGDVLEATGKRMRTSNRSWSSFDP